MPRLKSVSWRNWHSVMGLESARQEAFTLVIQPQALVGLGVDKLEAQGLLRAGGGGRELPLHPVAAGLGSQGETLAIRSEGPALVLSLDQILIPCAIRSLAARKPSILLCRASQPSQRAPQLAIPVRLLSIKPPSLAIAM